MTGVVRHPWGPRVYVGGLRVHHGSAGLALAFLAVLAKRPGLAAIGVAGVVHDRADFPWRDENNHLRT